MASFEFDLSELNTLAADLTSAPEKVGQQARTVVRKTALDVERDAKTFVPVDTGNLKNSISHSDLRQIKTTGDISAEVGPTASYGIFVELGTSRMAPHAYMGPALDRNTPGFVAAMEELGGDIL